MSSCESEQRESERRQQCDVHDDGESMSSSSQELEDVGLREEKALSDSEVKVSPTVCSISSSVVDFYLFKC